MNIEYLLGFVSSIIVMAIILLVIRKKSRGTCSYDERQELIRGRGFRYGFFVMAFLMVAGVILDQGMGGLPIELSLLMIGCVMAGCLVVVIYDIWKDAYWGVGQKARPYFILFLVVMATQCAALAEHIQAGDIVVNGRLAWDGGIFAVTSCFFAVVLVNLGVKMILDKKENRGE